MLDLRDGTGIGTRNKQCHVQYTKNKYFLGLILIPMKLMGLLLLTSMGVEGSSLYKVKKIRKPSTSTRISWKDSKYAHTCMCYLSSISCLAKVILSNVEASLRILSHQARPGEGILHVQFYCNGCLCREITVLETR